MLRRTPFLDVEVAPLNLAERRVATMAAGGMINRDIAQVLFVIPQPVEGAPLEHLAQARNQRRARGAVEPRSEREATPLTTP